MQRDLLSHLPVVRAVARCGGFAPAATQLGMSPSAVSHAVKTVEDGLGLPLFARTTRSVSLTEAGTSFLASVGPALTAIEEAAEQMWAVKGAVTGLLRLNVPRLGLRIGMTLIVAEMSWRYPDLTIEITVDDRPDAAFDQMQPVAAQILGACRGRRGSKERAEAFDGADVAFLRPRRELADRHVFDHPAAERTDGGVGHGGAP